MERVKAFPTAGAVFVEVTDELVIVDQDATGDYDRASITIPRALLSQVLGSIFAGLDIAELREVADAAELHAKSRLAG